MDIEIIKCKKIATIKEAMLKIEKNRIRTVFLVDEKDKLCGVVTDGDIRRGLLDGAGLNDSVSILSKDNFEYAKWNDSAECIAKKFSASVSIVPIVDADMHLIDFSEFHADAHLSLAMPQLNGNEYKYLMDAFLSTWISSAGKYINLFEQKFAEYCGVKYGVATSNGTTALHLALLALGVGAGDEVIVPDLTFAATINSVIYTGATPVIVDIEPDGWCIDVKKLEKAITPRTKAVIPVHLYGQPCDMGEVCRIAKQYGLFIIEDCAEAHGAEWNGKRVGGFGDISCFSFYGNKVITTGEGGMCITNDDVLNEKMRVYRDHGMRKERRYYHEVVGYNYRMTNMQAAVGVAQVEHIDDILSWRSKLELIYRESFPADGRVVLQRNDLQGRKKISWLVSILVDEAKRDEVIEKLKSNNVDVRSFFVPLSEMDIYKKYAREVCTVSRDISKKGINLPTTFEITKEDVKRIVQIICETI